MKSVRPLYLILGLLVVAAGICIGIALNPAVQRWALLRETRALPGISLSVGEVSAGLSHLHLGRVALEHGGLRVNLERLDADYSLFQLLVGRRLQVRQLHAAGLVVDASRLSPAHPEAAAAAAAGAPVVAPGLLARFQLPVALYLDDVQIAGRALAPGAPGQPMLETDYTISGGGFAPGREGSLLLTTELKNPAAGARVAALNAKINLRATQTAQRTFGQVTLSAVVDAEGENISDQNQLKIVAGLAQTAAGENYTCSIDSLLHGAPGQMLAVTATLPAGRSEYAGDWTLKVGSAQLEPFALGGLLPDFNAHGGGHFALDPAARSLKLSGQIDADVSRLEAIDPAWRAIGAVKLQSQFDAAAVDGVVRLQQLSLSLAGDQPVCELQAVQAAEFNLKERRLQVGGTAPGEVLNLKVSGLPLAWVRPFVHAVDVSGGMVTGRLSVTAEKDRLLIRSVAPLQVDALNVVRDGEPLLAKADIALNAEAALTASELQATISGLTLRTPAGDTVSAQARVVLPAAGANPAVTVIASYQSDLPKLLQPWLPLGHVKAAGDADFTLANGRIDLRRLSASVTDPAGNTLFKADALRPFALDLATRQALVADAGTTGGVDLMRVTLGHIPLDWIPLNQPGAKLDGMVEQGGFTLSTEAGKLILRAVSPLKLSGISLAQDGQPALAGLGVETQPVLEIAGNQSITARSGDVTVRTAAGGALLTCQGEVTRTAQTGTRASMTFNLEVPMLATQPLFAGAQAVAQGRASGEIRAAMGAGDQLEARLTLNGLVARDTGQTLPVANLSFRAVAESDGRLSVQAPLLLDRSGQRSDLNFSLELKPAGGRFDLDGKLTGDHVELADALSLVGVFLASAAPDGKVPRPAAAAAPATVTPDTAPPWSRFSGRLELDVKTITHGADWTMTGLAGLVTITPADVTLAKLEAAFGEKSRFAAKGALKFAPGAKPYQLGADFSLTEFDAGKLFKALEPGKAPTVEGTFTVNGNVTGAGETLNRTVEQTRGQFDLTSRQGIFRGLQRTSSKVSLTSKAVELGASVLGSILGSQTGTKAAEKVAGAAYFVDQFAQSVAELNYDQLNVRLVRDDNLNMRLEDFSLVSPEIRLLGKGTVTYVAGKPLLEQPLSVSLALAGRGKMEQLLGKLRLLDGSRDELGYAKTGQPITVAGTLARPDPSAFFTKIAASRLTDFLTPDN